MFAISAVVTAAAELKNFYGAMQRHYDSARGNISLGIFGCPTVSSAVGIWQPAGIELQVSDSEIASMGMPIGTIGGAAFEPAPGVKHLKGIVVLNNATLDSGVNVRAAIVAHEVGHIEHRHGAERRGKTTTQTREFEADAYAASICGSDAMLEALEQMCDDHSKWGKSAIYSACFRSLQTPRIRMLEMARAIPSMEFGAPRF